MQAFFGSFWGKNVSGSFQAIRELVFERMLVS